MHLKSILNRALAAQVLRLQGAAIRGSRRGTALPGSGHRAAGQRPADLLGLRREAARL